MFKRIAPQSEKPKHADTVEDLRDLLKEMRGLVETGSALDLTRLLMILTYARNEAQGCTHVIRWSNVAGRSLMDPMQTTRHAEFVHWANDILIRMRLIKDGRIEKPLTLEDVEIGERVIETLTGCIDEPKIWY